MSTISRWARVLWWFVKLELKLYVALGRWIVRRPAVPTGATPWGYSRLVTPVLWLWIFGSACELPLAHVLVPWHGVRIALLVLGVWGLVWMIGLLASLKVYPHLATASTLVVRHGKFAHLEVPWSQVDAVRLEDRGVEGGGLRALQPRDTGAGTEVQVPVNGRVNVTVRLTSPLDVQTSKGEVGAVSLAIWVDEPRDFVAAANQVVGARA